MRRIPSVIVVLTLALTPLVLTGPAHAGKPDVVLKKQKFNPEPITVKVGTTVTWFHDDGQITHTVTSDDESSFDSHPMCGEGGKCMLQGDTFQWTPTKVGQYGYHCKLMGGESMHGTVTVVN